MTKHRRMHMAVLAAIALVLAGCASSPEARWAQARTTLTTAQDSALVLHSTGAIDDETLVDRVNPAVQTARVALERAEALLPDEPGVLDMLDIAEAAVRRLEAVRKEYTDDQ
jgi:PBP1b-binding outer membrane lipoprotein LpoB